MDNPHYITPEEAAEKDCAIRPDEYWCKGPKCMAWRWKEYHEKVNDPQSDVQYKRIQSTTHGYCGMVNQS